MMAADESSVDATPEVIIPANTTPEDSRCYHCHEPVPAGFHAPVEFDNETRSTCCYGCQAVMTSIIDAGLADYYRFRTEPAQDLPEDIEARLDALQIYDEPEFTEQLLSDSTNPDGARLAEVTLAVDGVRCGACVWLLERTLRTLPGVQSVSVNSSTHRARLCFDSGQIALSAILQRMQQVGYCATPLDTRQREQGLARESRRQVQRLFVAGIAMMQVMMYALPDYLNGAGEIAHAHLQLLRWASMVLTIPVVFFSAAPFYAGACRSLRLRSAGMDVPVVIGVTVAFGVSVHNTLVQSGDVYFDSVSMFVFLLLLARYLEWSARCRSLRAIDDVSSQQVNTARQLIDGAYQTVPASRLQPGDTIRVDSGETVPVNGVLATSSGLIDCSVLSGESVPVSIAANDAVPGGAQVCGAPLTLSVTEPQHRSTLSVIARLIERGSADKPAMVALADRVAHHFVWCLLAYACVVFAAWLWVDSDRAAVIAITVLVVSCPCALSLATPAALAASTSQLIKQRLLITRGHVLETSAAVTDVVFDKTGTLTHGAPQVVAIDGADHHRALALAAALEEGAAHPFAAAVINYAAQHDVVPASVQVTRHEAGAGVEATVSDYEQAGTTVRIGSPAWCKLSPSDLERFNQDFSEIPQVASMVYLCESTAPQFASPVIIARFAIADTLRVESSALVSELQRQGLHVHLLSGDQQDVVEDCAAALTISTWRAAALPEQKQHYVQQLQRRGACVLMVGDGINDAPVLASADVSVAMGNATSIAQTSADVIALSKDLSIVNLLLSQARRTRAIVKQNLTWALAYNITVIPAASLGWISPWLAAIGMALSSLLVAGNASRLWWSGRAEKTVLSSPDTNHSDYSKNNSTNTQPKVAERAAWNH